MLSVYYIKSGNIYSRTCSTTIDSESLTAVFGMGTGGAFTINHRKDTELSIKIETVWFVSLTSGKKERRVR